MNIQAHQNDNSICQKLANKADRLYHMGQYDQAVDLLVAAIQHYAGNKSLYIKLGTILIDSDQFKDAFAILQQVPGEEEDSVRLELSGYCQFGLGRYAEADKIADRILAGGQDAAGALNLKGILAHRRDEKMKAEDYFLRASRVAGEYGAPCINLARIRQEENQTAAALDLFEKGFTLSPLVKEAVLAYHTAITAHKAYDRAELAFERALQSFPLNKRLVYLFIDVLLHLSKFDRAMLEIEKSLALFGLEDGILAAALYVRDKLGEMPSGDRSTGKGLVSLCMITKNEENHLARCLYSVKPIVDEMIIVDTGSDDRTRDIATVFGARLFDCKWEDDFASARNVSLDHASGDWILVMDADEVISHLDYEYFNNLVKQNGTGPKAYRIITRNYTLRNNTVGWTANDGRYLEEESGTGWFPSEKVRLFPNLPDIQFEYPVHEMVEPTLKQAGVPIAECSMPVHHYGRLNEQRSAAKGEAYYSIGRQKLDKMGDNIVALRELAIQAGNLEKFDEAIELWQRFVQRKPGAPEAFVNLSNAHWQLGRYDEALINAQKAVDLAPAMKESHFNCAISQLGLGQVKPAISTLEALLDRHPDYLAARFMLAAAHCCGGEKLQSKAGIKKLRQTDPGLPLDVSFCDLAKRLAAAEQTGFAILLLEAAVENDYATEDVLNLLKECRKIQTAA